MQDVYRWAVANDMMPARTYAFRMSRMSQAMTPDLELDLHHDAEAPAISSAPGTPKVNSGTPADVLVPVRQRVSMQSSRKASKPAGIGAFSIPMRPTTGSARLR